MTVAGVEGGEGAGRLLPVEGAKVSNGRKGGEIGEVLRLVPPVPLGVHVGQQCRGAAVGTLMEATWMAWKSRGGT